MLHCHSLGAVPSREFLWSFVFSWFRRWHGLGRVVFDTERLMALVWMGVWFVLQSLVAGVEGSTVRLHVF